MEIGYAECRSCGKKERVEDLISGLCPVCARVRVDRLARYQREYQDAVDAGDAAASARVAEIIAQYEERECVQLKAAYRSEVRGSIYPKG